MNEERRVRVEWDGPFSVEEVTRKYDSDSDYGLYQVYGEHVVFGSDSLLYIGKACKQSFARRIQQHAAGWLSEENAPMIYLGQIVEGDYVKGDKNKDWEEVVDAVEALTIYWHSPPYNSQHINEYGRMALRVQNLEKLGSLVQEYSSSNIAVRNLDGVPG